MASRPLKIRSLKEFKKLLLDRNIAATYLFIGNGPRLQYQDIQDVNNKVGAALEHEPGQNSFRLSILIKSSLNSV